MDATAVMPVWDEKRRLLRPEVVRAHPIVEDAFLGVLTPNRMPSDNKMALFGPKLREINDRFMSHLEPTGSAVRNALASDRVSLPRVYMMMQAKRAEATLGLLNTATNVLTRFVHGKLPRLKVRCARSDFCVISCAQQLMADTGAWHIDSTVYVMVSVLAPGDPKDVQDQQSVRHRLPLTCPF